MLATSLQQWARRYLQNTQQTGRGLHERARIRASFANGVTTFHVPRVVEALPALVHLALFIFFAGLLVYLFKQPRSVRRSVLLGGTFVGDILIHHVYANFLARQPV